MALPLMAFLVTTTKGHQKVWSVDERLWRWIDASEDADWATDSIVMQDRRQQAGPELPPSDVEALNSYLRIILQYIITMEAFIGLLGKDREMWNDGPDGRVYSV